MIKKERKQRAHITGKAGFSWFKFFWESCLLIFVFFPYATEWNAMDTHTMQLKWSFWNERKNKSSLRSYISSVYTKHDSIFTLNKSCSYSSSCCCDDIQVHARIITHGVLWLIHYMMEFIVCLFHIYMWSVHKKISYKFLRVMMNNNSEQQPRGMECQWTKNYLVHVCMCVCVFLWER